MHNKIILILVALILIPTVTAELTRLDIPIFMDFISDSEFNIMWDGGIRNFRWDNSSFPNDINFTAPVYRDLDTTAVCTDQEGRFTNLTNKMVDMVAVCQALADNNNISMALEYGDAKFAQGLQSEKIETCNAALAEAQTKAGQYESCNADRMILRPQLNNCTASLEKKGDSSKAGYVVVGLLCLGAGWLFWGRKKGVPPEIKEEGFESY